MSEENVEIARQSYAAYNAAFSAPHPRKALRAALERHADPEIEWEVDPLRPVAFDAARIARPGLLEILLPRWSASSRRTERLFEYSFPGAPAGSRSRGR
jgi:hypothetical protein